MKQLIDQIRKLSDGQVYAFELAIWDHFGVERIDLYKTVIMIRDHLGFSLSEVEELLPNYLEFSAEKLTQIMADLALINEVMKEVNYTRVSTLKFNNIRLLIAQQSLKSNAV